MAQENNNNTYAGRRSRPEHVSQFDHGGRVPPRDNDLEEAVLGALMLEKDAYTVVCDILKPESFYDTSNQKIYAAIQSLGAAQQSIDMLTVTEKLRLNGDLEAAGGALRISELTSRVASGAHVEFHARIVAQKYLARELIRFASQIEAQAFDESYDVDDLLQEAEGKLFEISQRNVKKDVTQIDPVINSAIEQIQISANRASGLSGLNRDSMSLTSSHPDGREVTLSSLLHVLRWVRLLLCCRWQRTWLSITISRWRYSRLRCLTFSLLIV